MFDGEGEVKMGVKRMSLPIIGTALVSLLVGMVWFAISNEEPATFASIDFPVYSSVEELSAVSDAVVIGTVKAIVGHEVDYGTANPDEEYGLFKNQIKGVEMVYYEIAVTETLRGEPDESIIVARMDVGQTICDEVTPLRDGEEVLLFLREKMPGDAPGLTLYDHFYVTVSLDNGVFDVLTGDLVQPRYAEAFVEPGEDGTFEPPTYALQEVCEKIQADELPVH